VGPKAISKKSNNVVISSPRDFIFSRILIPKNSFPYIWSRDLERFRFGRQGAPKIFSQIRFSRFPKFFQGRVPPNGPYLSSGVMGSGVKFVGQAPQSKIFVFFCGTSPGAGGGICRMEIIVTGDPFDV